jgi:excisionase family DNA binding protein
MNATQQLEPLRSVKESAEMFGVCERTIRNQITKGCIRPVRIGRRVLIESSELRRLIEDSRALPVSA